jgi:hypothetical protein
MLNSAYNQQPEVVEMFDQQISCWRDRRRDSRCP